jgi:hypothetical protein
MTIKWVLRPIGLAGALIAQNLIEADRKCRSVTKTRTDIENDIRNGIRSIDYAWEEMKRLDFRLSAAIDDYDLYMAQCLDFQKAHGLSPVRCWELIYSVSWPPIPVPKIDGAGHYAFQVD